MVGPNIPDDYSNADSDLFSKSRDISHRRRQLSFKSNQREREVEVILTLICAALSAALFWHSFRLWRRWHNTRKNPILERMARGKLRFVSPALAYDRPRAPRSSRWPEFGDIQSTDEADAYQRLALSRSKSYTIYGDIFAAFGGALAGSVSFDVITQGPSTPTLKVVVFYVALTIIVVGVFLSRVWSELWKNTALRYGTCTKKSNVTQRKRVSVKAKNRHFAGRKYLSRRSEA